MAASYLVSTTVAIEKNVSKPSGGVTELVILALEGCCIEESVNVQTEVKVANTEVSHSQRFKRVVFCEGNDNYRDSFWRTISFCSVFNLSSGKLLKNSGQKEFMVVSVVRLNDFIHEDILGKSVEKELKLASFSINLNNGYVVTDVEEIVSRISYILVKQRQAEKHRLRAHETET